MRHSGELVLRSQLESMVEVLDHHLFLEGPRLEAERARQRAAFLGAATRPAFLAGRSYDDEPDALATALTSHFVAPDGPGPIGSVARGHGARPRRAAHRLQPGRPRVRLGIPRARRGGGPRLLHRPGNGPRGARRPSLRGHRQALRDPVRPARGGSRGPGRDRPPGADRSLGRRAGPPERALHRVPGGLAPVSRPPGRRPRAAHRAAPRELRQRVPRPRREPRPGRRHRGGAGGRARRDGHRPAPLLHRGGRRSRARRAPLRGRLARSPRRSWRASRRRTGRSSPPSSRWTRRASSRRPDDRPTGIGSVDCRRSTPSCGSCPEGRGGCSATVSGPTRTGRSPSRA